MCVWLGCKVTEAGGIDSLGHYEAVAELMTTRGGRCSRTELPVLRKRAGKREEERRRRKR